MLFLKNLVPGADVEAVVEDVVGRLGSMPDSLVVAVNEDMQTEQYGSLVHMLKSLCDVMVVAEVPANASHQLVEKAFTAGFHALLFNTGQTEATIADITGVGFAVNLFSSGAVFVSQADTMDELDVFAYISSGVVPLCGMGKETMDSLLSRAGLDGRWLYYLGHYNAGSLGMRERVVKKYLLEMANLKHKLRVSQVDQSLESSSL